MMSEPFFSRSSQPLIPLENIRVASPCRADWNLMEGDERVRFCQSCAKNVYNLSALNKADAEKLIAEKEGKLCIRYYQRADGTILTDNCPVGLKIVRRPFKWLLAGFAALLASGFALMAHEQTKPQAPRGTRVCKPVTLDTLRGIPVVGSVVNYFSPKPQPAVMGMIAYNSTSSLEETVQT